MDVRKTVCCLIVGLVTVSSRVVAQKDSIAQNEARLKAGDSLDAETEFRGVGIRLWNSWLADLCAAAPERLLGLMQIDSPNGTIGRLRGDSALIQNIHRDYAALDSLIADMKKHPLRYSPF